MIAELKSTQVTEDVLYVVEAGSLPCRAAHSLGYYGGRRDLGDVLCIALHPDKNPIRQSPLALLRGCVLEEGWPIYSCHKSLSFSRLRSLLRYGRNM